MKLRCIFLAFFISLLLFCCSKNDSESDESWGLPDLDIPSILISNDCDCPPVIANDCSELIFLSEVEYNRIVEIYEQSEEPCVYVIGTALLNEPFEGFVIKINERNN